MARAYLLHEALEAVFRTVIAITGDSGGQARVRQDPANRLELERVLAALVRQLARQAVYLAPVMPGKAEALWEALGGPGSAAETSFEQADHLDCTGWHVAKGEGLFPRPEPPKPAA